MALRYPRHRSRRRPRAGSAVRTWNTRWKDYRDRRTAARSDRPGSARTRCSPARTPRCMRPRRPAVTGSRWVDMLARRRARREPLYQALVRSSADLVAVLDREGIVRYVNPAARALLG